MSRPALDVSGDSFGRATICSTCADACLSEQHGGLTQCIRLDLDCADICSATARVLSRASKHGPQPLQALLAACASACRACAQECRRHEQHSHCRICAESCETCEAECEELLKDRRMAGQRDVAAEVPPTWARGTV